jgi:hypothetical protein
MKPWNEFFKIAGKICVVSLIAVGEKSINTPILQMSKSNIKGIILNNIEGMLIKYF